MVNDPYLGYDFSCFVIKCFCHMYIQKITENVLHNLASLLGRAANLILKLQGGGQSVVFGGGSNPGHGEREPITGVWWRSPQRGPGQNP